MRTGGAERALGHGFEEGGNLYRDDARDMENFLSGETVLVLEGSSASSLSQITVRTRPDSYRGSFDHGLPGGRTAAPSRVARTGRSSGQLGAFRRRNRPPSVLHKELLEPDPREDNMAHRFEIDRGIRECLRPIRGLDQRSGDIPNLLGGLVETLGQFRCFTTGVPRSVDSELNCRDERLEARAVLHGHLASEQVETLDPVCALVDRVEPVVPVELFDVVVTGVSVATEDLDGQVVRSQAPLRWPALRNGVRTSSSRVFWSRICGSSAVSCSSTSFEQYSPSAKAPST